MNGYLDAKYRAFGSKSEAEKAFRGGYPGSRKDRIKIQNKFYPFTSKPVTDSYSVDAACSGNPGALEFRCVYNKTGKQIFRKGPYKNGTNNIGEFLAIVHALIFLKEKGITRPVYSDSKNAISWILKKECKTQLSRNKKNEEIFELIERAESWLKNNAVINQVLKWQTEAWGEIPADFGRK